MSDRSEFIQAGDSLDRYLEKVSVMEQSNERLVRSYAALGSTWERIASALASLSKDSPQTR